MGDNMEVNLPFERLPVCSCDSGNGSPPSKQRMLECRLSGGPCSPNYYKQKTDATRAGT
jgi:hypothetical protein